MKTDNYDSNLLNLQFSIENNIGKWAMMPSSACNHVYNSLPIEKEKPDEEYIAFENPEEFEEEELDVPGSELDDQQESVGSEDEENNYYSIGGDDHNDLEENNGN